MDHETIQCFRLRWEIDPSGFLSTAFALFNIPSLSYKFAAHAQKISEKSDHQRKLNSKSFVNSMH